MSSVNYPQHVERFSHLSHGTIRTERHTEAVTPAAAEETLAKESFGLQVMLVCLWFALQPISSDITNYLTFRFVVNLRPDRLVFLFLVLAFLFRRKERVGIAAVEVTLATTLVVAFWSYLVAGPPDSNQRYVSTIFSFFAIPLATFSIARRIRWTRSYLSAVLGTFLIVGVYLGLTGIFEHYRIDALVFPKYILDPSVGTAFGRSRGPFAHPVMFGSSLTMIFFSCLLFFSRIKKGSFYRGFVALSMVVMLASIYFSYTRAVWLMFGVAALVLGAVSRSGRRLVVTIGVLVVLVAASGVSEKLSFYSPTLFSRRSSTIDDRLNIMMAAWNMFRDEPIVGHGYGNFERKNDDYFTFIEGVPMRGNGEGNHNAVLGLLAETGLAGGVPYLMTFFLLLVSTLRTVRRQGEHVDPARVEMASVFLAVLCGYFLSVQTTDPRFYTMLNAHLFFLAGLCSARFASESTDAPMPMAQRATSGSGSVLPVDAARHDGVPRPAALPRSNSRHGVRNGWPSVQRARWQNDSVANRFGRSG